MSRRTENQRAMAGLLVCLVLGFGLTMWSFGFEHMKAGASKGAAALIGAALVVLSVSALTGVLVFAPYGFVALGWLRLRKTNADELPDDNTVGDPVEGERKYQQWLSAMNSTEAYLGMVPRSEPYVPPEHRPPPDAKPPRTRLNRVGWNVLGAGMVTGAAVGLVAGHMHGLGASADSGQGLVQLIAAGLVGMILSLPFAAVSALLIGRLETRVDADEETSGPTEGKDDARTGGTETA